MNQVRKKQDTRPTHAEYWLLLPTINYCQLTSTIVNYFQLMSNIGNCCHPLIIVKKYQIIQTGAINWSQLFCKPDPYHCCQLPSALEGLEPHRPPLVSWYWQISKQLSSQPLGNVFCGVTNISGQIMVDIDKYQNNFLLNQKREVVKNNGYFTVRLIVGADPTAWP